MTIRNLSIELGAKIGMIAPDATTFEYLAGRRFAPQGAAWDQAVAHWRTLVTDDDATFDREVSMTPTPSRRKSPGAPTPSTSSRSMM